MYILTLDDTTKISRIVREFMDVNPFTDKQAIPIDLLKYLRNHDIKVEDAGLFEELCSMIEQKYF